MLSKRSQVPSFLRCEEEGQRVHRGRDGRWSEGGKSASEREGKRARAQQKVCVCVPLGVKR